MEAGVPSGLRCFPGTEDLTSPVLGTAGPGNRSARRNLRPFHRTDRRAHPRRLPAPSCPCLQRVVTPLPPGWAPSAGA